MANKDLRATESEANETSTLIFSKKGSNANSNTLLSTDSSISESKRVFEDSVEESSTKNDGECIIKRGSTFNDYESLLCQLQLYQKANHVRLYKRDSRTIQSIIRRRRSPNKLISQKLKYGEITFRCRHGGKLYKSTSTGIRPNQSSFKQGCEMHIRFGVSDDGSQLVVKSMSEEHNHEINEESVVKEALHPELCSFVSKLVWGDTNIGIDDVKKQLENYVCNDMFKDQSPPPRTRRQYFPSKKQIRYFMAKAKASLNISQEAELKLAAQAERLKETHSDEKMIFNFKVKHDIGPLDLTVTTDEHVDQVNEEYISGDGETQNQDNAKVLFCHQTPHQQRLLKRYSSQAILTQLVGEFILQANTSDMIVEALQTIKDWNPGWNPKFVVVDYSDEQINAVESVFQGVFLLISDASREQAWIDWLNDELNDVSEHKDEVIKYLQAIANSYSEDTLNTAARELEESEVWKMSDKMRNWFQLHWLSQAKRWVAGYRPDDYLMTCHSGRTLNDEMKTFKSIKLVNKTSPLQDVIQQLVEHVVPVAKKQYELLNQESFKLQNELFYLYPDIPNYFSCHPGKLTYHIYERIKLAAEQSYVISYLHPGIFSVQGSSAEDDLLHTVSFGDSTSFPSCDCADWQQFKLPCCHLCAVFGNYPGWNWDMLSVAYKSHPVLNVDWSTMASGDGKEVPGFRVNSGTQTTGATLLSGATELSKISRMSDNRRVTETPQVLASQCRGFLQQLSKLQLAHHSRENLCRLKAELKELISIFASAPKQKQTISSPGLTGSYIIQSKGPGRPRKGSLPASPSGSVFEQYNVKPITPKQVDNGADKKLYPLRTRAANTELVISKATGDLSNVDGENEGVLNTVYIVDPSQILTNEENSSTVVLSKPSTESRKRIQNSSVFFKPPEKRGKIEEDNESEKTEILERSVSLEFPDDTAGTLLIDTDAAVTAILDNHSILRQVAMSENQQTPTLSLSDNSINTESFTIAESVAERSFDSSNVDGTIEKNITESVVK